jgi:AcrR family transcriptional regulator
MNKRSAGETRKNILEAAQSVFTDHGYAQASMRIIAREAGTSVGGLYLYFRNKEELYLTLMQDRMKKLSDLTGEALFRVDDPAEAIAAFISISIEFARKNKEILILQGRELGFSFGIDRKREFLKARRELLADIIRKGMKSGIFRECDADETAWIIFNMLRGVVISMVIDEDESSRAEAYIDLVLRGLSRREN